MIYINLTSRGLFTRLVGNSLAVKATSTTQVPHSQRSPHFFRYKPDTSPISPIQTRDHLATGVFHRLRPWTKVFRQLFSAALAWTKGYNVIQGASSMISTWFMHSASYGNYPFQVSCQVRDTQIPSYVLTHAYTVYPFMKNLKHRKRVLTLLKIGYPIHPIRSNLLMIIQMKMQWVWSK